MDHRGGQLGHLNGPMAVSLPLGDMPMEALDAALADLDGDPHHELALDQAAMDLHDNDEVCLLPSNPIACSSQAVCQHHSSKMHAREHLRLPCQQGKRG